MLSKLKDDILRLLKEDEEFRYAVIGLLGLQRLEEAVTRLVDIQARVESRLARVEEEQVSIKSRMDRIEETIIRLGDAVTRLVDIQARMESRLTKVEEAVARLTDSHIELRSIVARLADIQARQEERLAKVEERLIKVEERLEEHDRKFNAILEELNVHRAKLEEHDRKFNEIIIELRDLRRVSDEHTKILQVHTKILEEHTKRFDEHTKILQVHTKILEEHTKRFDEHTKILQVHTRMLDKHDRRFNDVIGMMYHGFEQLGRFAGVSLESLVRSILTKAMQESGELSKDKEITNITIDGEEIDVFCDDPLIVGEVTSYADSIDEVYKLIKKSELIRERFKKEPRLILIITNIKKEVYEDIVREAEANGIEVIAGKRV